MAETFSAKKPDEILQALHGIGDYRETLTRHAAGVIWIIWGLVFACIGLFSLAFFLGAPDSGWPDVTSIVVFGAAGAIATNVVWRSHALERDAKHPAWLAWIAGIGTPIFIGLVVSLSNLGPSWGPPSFMMAPLMLLGSGGALTMALLQRRHVPATAGYVASALLLAAFIFARFGPLERTEALDTVGNAVLSLVNLLAFLVVGLTHIRRG